MFRWLSLAIRALQSAKKKKQILKAFSAFKLDVDRPVHKGATGKLLLIRLDDIGDYIVFRNFLAAYKLSERWRGYEITLLGNSAWKNLFESFDSSSTDHVIWLNKSKYFKEGGYRKAVWQQLYDQKFEVVICPSRTRPLLLDDVCALATSAGKKIGSPNTNKYRQWNAASDGCYDELFSGAAATACTHDFIFNKSFTEWCCRVQLNDARPVFESLSHLPPNDYLIFFVGANSGSRRWPLKNWINLIKLVQANDPRKIYIAGGPDDVPGAEAIVAAAKDVESIAGKYSLADSIKMMAKAKAVVTNNTMAAHAAVACHVPVIIVSSGDNYFRFTEYGFLENPNVATVYPRVFLSRLGKHARPIPHYDAVSADIATIPAGEVFNALKKILD